jgi:hypothetical protein
VPKIAVVKRWAYVLHDAASATVKWTAKKLDTAAEEAAKTAGKAAGVAAIAFEPHVQAAIAQAYQTVLHWLHTVTIPF